MKVWVVVTITGNEITGTEVMDTEPQWGGEILAQGTTQFVSVCNINDPDSLLVRIIEGKRRDD